MAPADRMDPRLGHVRDPVGRAFPRISMMTRAAAPIGISRQIRWPESGRPAPPVKAGLRPPPSAADGLDRACCSAFVSHQAFDGGLRLIRTQPHSTSRTPLTQMI